MPVLGPFFGARGTPSAAVTVWRTLPSRCLGGNSPRWRRLGACGSLAAFSLGTALASTWLGPPWWPVAGDNLAVVRYGAAQGRLHRPEMQGILESVLAKLPAAGWSISWLAMRRCFNGAADKLATAALDVASVLAQAGKMVPFLF